MIQAPPNPATDRNAGPGPATRELVEQTRLLVEQNARRWKRLLLLEAIGLAVSAPLSYLWLVFLLDNLLHLPVWGRFLGSAGFVVCLVWLGVKLVRRWRQVHFTEDRVALAMERRTPGGVQNRLINAIQLARDARANQREFSEAAVLENCEHLQQMELQQAAQVKPALIRVAAAIILIGIGLLFWMFSPSHFTNAASRILLPFADIDPLYRTVLVVEPGNVEGMGDIPIRIHIRGERPGALTILRNLKGNRASETIPVEAGADTVNYTFKAVEQSMTYAVRGGDFTSPFYRIDVPTPSLLSLVRATYQYPAYTRLAEKTIESAGGDLEALQGTRVQITFVFDQPADEASLLVQQVAAKGQVAETPERVLLTKVGSAEFSGEIVFAGVAGYQIETRQGSRPVHLSSPYSLRVLVDQEPKLELRGLERQSEALLEAVLPVQITATDDYGLEKVGLFFRRTTTRAQDKQRKGDEWTAVEVWQANRGLELRRNLDLSVASLGAIEGDKVEVAPRAVDTDPLKKGNWTTGTVYGFRVGGEGVPMQILYEQILQTEAEFKAILAGQQQAMAKATEWGRKFDPTAGLKWDDPKNVADLKTAMKEQSKAQEELHQSAGKTAKNMVAQAGNLRLSLGMLADTEMIRAVRILDTVEGRDTPQNKRSTLADARLTQERIIRSLQEILDNYVKFRQDWELAHMVPFTKMLADRQTALRDESLKNAQHNGGKTAEPRQTAMQRRQTKILELSQLAQAAFAGLVDKIKNLEPGISQAFAAAAKELAAEELKMAMRQAADDAKAGHWSEAAPKQTRAAEMLTAIHARLRQAQTEAAQRALSALQEKAKSDVEAQKGLTKLQAGNSDTFLDIKNKLKLEDIIHMQEQEQNKNAEKEKTKVWDWNFPDSMRGMLQQPDSGKRQEFKNLSLAKSPTGEPSFPHNSDRAPNKVTPHIQEKFEDLVGKLLEEADDIKEKYETYNINVAFNINEPGDVGKQAGSLNSTAAAAATGNMKPPTQNVGGASRSGRKGARAHGMSVGDESINRRGRDKVQEGQERVGDQAGTMKEKKSEDMQKDTSTGVGGKKVDSEDAKFSLADTGKWTDDMAKRMDKAKEKHSIVERQDGKLDPRVAEMLRDLNNRQEQLIERVKIIRKELRNLYLPTDHLDEILAELTANLASLKERPNAELFRLQRQALDRLRGTVRVFQQAHAGFQPSVPREQVIEGRILDEPARQTLPGYEEAVKQYYEKLATR